MYVNTAWVQEELPEGMTIIARAGDFIATIWQHGRTEYTTHAVDVPGCGIILGHYFTTEDAALGDLAKRALRSACSTCRHADACSQEPATCGYFAK